MTNAVPPRRKSVSLGRVLVVVFFGLALGNNIVKAQEEVFSSFRVLSAEASNESSPALINPPEEIASRGSSHQVIWLAGTIEELGGGWTYQDALPSKNENQMVVFQDDSSVIGRALENAEEEMNAPVNVQVEDCLDCEVPGWIEWKSTTVSGSWLPGSGDRLGTGQFNISGKIIFPRMKLISITPVYQMYYLNGPERTDLPSTLYNASIGITGTVPISDRWLGQVNVSPGVSSDFQTSSSEKNRVTGYGLLIFSQSPQTQWIFGVAYLDREDISVVALAGVNWSPNEQTRVELIFPRPRIKRLLSKSGESEKWGYVGVEFGGGSWAIERSSGVDDVVTINEYRVLAGIEYKLPQSRSWFWETGVVLGRSVEYSSGNGDYDPGATFVLGGGITF